MWNFVMDKVALGWVFSEYFILIYHQGLYNRPNWPQYQGLRYLGTQYRPTNNKKIIIIAKDHCGSRCKG
jgi:hypothetical protein